MNSSSKEIQWQRLARLIAGTFCVLYIISRFLPSALLAEYPVVDSLENSWTQILHLAFLNNFQFGTEIVFTYGPWGFMARGYHPGTFGIAFGAWFALTVVFMLAGWKVACRATDHRVLAGIWLVMFAFLTTMPLGEDINTRLLAWCVLLLLLYFFVEDRVFTWRQAMLATTLGWMGLIKFTGSLEGLVVVSVITIDGAFRRKFPWALVCWLAGFLFFWWLAGQGFLLLPEFFKNSWLITMGYGEAMMLSDKNELWRVLCFAVISLLECLLIAKLTRVRLNIFGLLPLVAFGALLFIAFKLGYVRSGWQHECTSALMLVLVALACFAMKPREPGRFVRPAVGLLVATVVFAALVFGRWFPNEGLATQVAATFRPTSIFAPMAVIGTSFLKDKFEEQLAKERSRFSITNVNGSVDLYAYDQSVLIANGLQYQPRPVMQSYSAYTPELAAMNAAHLRTPSAASNILFAIQTIDGRFPSLDDGLSWPELLTRYELVGTNGGFLKLARRPVPHSSRLVSLKDLNLRMGENTPVPAMDGLLWVEMGVRQTWAGRMVSFFYKPPVLTISVELADGMRKEFRLVPGMARGGFLLSPVVAGNEDFAALLNGTWQQTSARNLVKSITVSEQSRFRMGTCYQPSIQARFYQFEWRSP